MRESEIKAKHGTVNFYLTVDNHWVAYIEELYFDFYGCGPSKSLPVLIIENLENFFKECK